MRCALALLLTLTACGGAPSLSERLTNRYCGFWGCTGVDPATEWCHEDYDALASLHEQALIAEGHVIDEDMVEACVADMGGGPDGDPYCECGGCVYAACCACTSNPVRALNHLYGVPPPAK